MLVPVCLPASGGHGPIITPPAVGTGDSLHGRSSCCGAVTLAASAVPARGSLTRHTGAAGVFATLTGGPAWRYDDLAVLTTATLAFALGVDTVEGTMHLRRAEAGAAVGLGAVPELRTLRERLSALAQGCDPLELQRAFATAMLATDPAGDPVYFVDGNHSGPGRCEAGDGRTIAAGPVSSWAGEPVPGFSGLVGQRRYGLDAAAGSQGRPANRSRSTARACWPFLRAVDR